METRLHNREILVLNTLFEVDSPMTSLDIILKNEGLSQSTVQAVLRKLYREKLVEVVDIVRSGNVPARAYKGTEKARKEVLFHMLEQYERVQSIISREEVIHALINAESDKDKREGLLNSIFRMIDQD